MRPRPVRYAVATLLLLGALAACGQGQNGTAGTGTPTAPTRTAPTRTAPTPPSSSRPVTGPATGRVTLTGVPQAGVEASCVLLGRYLLIGGTPAQRALLDAGTVAGGTVTLTGHTDPTQLSYCQQGTILVVDEVRAGS